ncbi:MAG: amidase [Halolamina sp.]|uniref:amidase n=1 Tax=Halolamina sp. TaxID=1940283 RepID=UPI002FC3AC48
MTTHENRLADAVAELQRGQRTPTEYAESALGRLAAVEADVRAFLPEPDRQDRLAMEAAELEAEYGEAKPPLYGVPVGVKDIFHIDGFPTHAGSNLPPEALAGAQAETVSALLEAGAIVFGKTVTTEFAYFEPGPTRNPHDLDRTPGGSSSGSAAAVAAGVVPLALGSQTVGSVIRPASFCGVVGVKPSYGRLPLDGVLPLSPSADHVGFFTQDAAGARIAAEVLAPEWEGPDSGAAEKPVIGVPHENYLSQAEDAMIAQFDRELDALRDAGYEIRQTDALGDIDPVNERHRDMVAAEAALEHAALYEEYGDQYATGTVELLEKGHEVDVDRLVDARNGRRTLRAELARRMDETGVDLWASPAAPGPAPEGIGNTGDPVMNLPWTHAGLPTVGLPAGELGGLPVGIQFTGRFGADEQLLAWTESLEAAL